MGTVGTRKKGPAKVEHDHRVQHIHQDPSETLSAFLARLTLARKLSADTIGHPLVRDGDPIPAPPRDNHETLIDPHSIDLDEFEIYIVDEDEEEEEE